MSLTARIAKIHESHRIDLADRVCRTCEQRENILSVIREAVFSKGLSDFSKVVAINVAINALEPLTDADIEAANRALTAMAEEASYTAQDAKGLP